jgi:hypothetical protein
MEGRVQGKWESGSFVKGCCCCLITTPPANTRAARSDGTPQNQPKLIGDCHDLVEVGILGLLRGRELSP